ncbi:hypothetical protein [Pyxidicoccus xibeiensis]|uniref:hypothetical protein n=1 Tax=Pyxidicoccus xibeiensis TaxID=2906759 RepID=UPI0020A754A9|nr:hypothetical protein [Pyxidicoccus xibeiensis]MCP3139403.1 hypothetical protein [Pyxidicoccus xibeiensis]
MREWTVRRWSQLAVVGVGMLLGTACGGLPETGGKQPDEPRGNFFAQRMEQPEVLKDMAGNPPKHALPPHTMSADRGYNETIKQRGSSIDPRTPRTDGKQNNSIVDDPGKMMQDRYSGIGGAAYSPSAQGLGGEDGSKQGSTASSRVGVGYAPLGWQDRSAHGPR